MAVYRLPYSWAGRFSLAVPVELLVLLGGQGPRWGRIRRGRSLVRLLNFSVYFEKRPGAPDRSAWTRSASACAEGVSSRSTQNGVVNTVGGARGVSLSVPPDLVASGTWVSRFSAKGVAAVEPCGENPYPTGSSAAGGTSVAGEKALTSR